MEFTLTGTRTTISTRKNGNAVSEKEFPTVASEIEIRETVGETEFSNNLCNICNEERQKTMHCDGRRKNNGTKIEPK